MRLYHLYFLVFLVLIFGSCNFFEVKKVNSDEVLARERSKLLAGGVGEYPLFEACKDKEHKALQKKCFQQELCNHIAAYLKEQAFIIETSVQDTLWIPLLIDSIGIVTIEDFEVPDFIADQEPPITILLEESVQMLPALQPAHIRGIPVATRYRLPLVFITE